MSPANRKMFMAADCERAERGGPQFSGGSGRGNSNICLDNQPRAFSFRPSVLVSVQRLLREGRERDPAGLFEYPADGQSLSRRQSASQGTACHHS